MSRGTYVIIIIHCHHWRIYACTQALHFGYCEFHVFGRLANIDSNFFLNFTVDKSKSSNQIIQLLYSLCTHLTHHRIPSANMVWSYTPGYDIYRLVS